MVKTFSKLSEFLEVKSSGRKFFYLSILFFAASWLFWILHFNKAFYGNYFTWIFWLLSLVFLVTAFFPDDFSLIKLVKRVPKEDYYLLVIVLAIYWTTHLWNFHLAPWNQNGLFDDAAWDIYFAKNHVFNSAPFQAAYFDTVGYISREVIFHYYITIFFKLFGYNLLVFNASLLILGFITVLFTVFIIQRLWRNYYISFICLLVINFFPLQYMHIFMGHRYAIAAPLIAISLFYLYTAFKYKSGFQAVISSVFAALCWDSAIMGKQYLLALSLSLVATLLLQRSTMKVKENKRMVLLWVISFFIASIPMVSYVVFNWRDYNLREGNLIKDFLAALQLGRLGALMTYGSQLRDLFFDKVNFRRQFLPDFPIIPLAYYLLIIPGLFIAFFKKRYEIVLLSLIPIIGAFVSGPYDFRVLLSVPAWVISISFLINFLAGGKAIKRPHRQIMILLTGTVLLVGLLPSIDYLWKVSRDTHHLWLLPHKDVGVSRFVQDIVVGSEEPSPLLKKDEFNRVVDNQSYDTLFCPYSSYAIAHLYLQNYDDKKVLSLCDQGIQLLKSPAEIMRDNKNAISDYRSDDKDLVLIWEMSDKSSSIISYFRSYNKYGSDKLYSGSIDGQHFSLYALRINKERISDFKKDVVSVK